MSEIQAKENKVMKVCIIILLICILATFIGSAFVKDEQRVVAKNEKSESKNEELESKIEGVLATNNVLENENNSLTSAYEDWSYLGLLEVVYDSYNMEINNGDIEGEYDLVLTGAGKDNPYVASRENYRVYIHVNLNENKCYFNTASDTYVKYIIMAENYSG